ncbi:MAG: hypothetical protein Q4C12_05045 [Clostridia bacterium]|nr:hypothetical protein [Clostridia bacterium]
MTDETITSSFGCKDKVCIQTDQVYDSCRSKECIECLRVYMTETGQEIIDRALDVKCKKSEIIWVFSDVERLPFNSGYYTVDLNFFFKITLEVFTGINRPVTVEGLATFEKKVVLFGSEGSAKIFTSKFKEDAFDAQLWQKTNMPKAVVEVVDPICLGAKLSDINDHCCRYADEDLDVCNIPDCIRRVFDDRIIGCREQGRRVFVTIGLFSIVRLERNVQLLIPAYDFCIPDKECVASTEDDPCNLFEKISFPVDEFFPPQSPECFDQCDNPCSE